MCRVFIYYKIANILQYFYFIHIIGFGYQPYCIGTYTILVINAIKRSGCTKIIGQVLVSSVHKWFTAATFKTHFYVFGTLSSFRYRHVSTRFAFA